MPFLHRGFHCLWGWLVLNLMIIVMIHGSTLPPCMLLSLHVNTGSVCMRVWVRGKDEGVNLFVCFDMLTHTSLYVFLDFFTVIH